ncbi:hypothetical protein LCGC14_2361260, partial [marine sediment metagenome]
MDKKAFNFFKMGGALAEMLTRGWMGEYDDFGSMVEGEFGLRNRKALYLISIYHAIVSCGATWDEVKEIGWSKLGLIAASLTPENYKAWFEKISDSSHATIRELVKHKEKGGNPPPADVNSDSTPKKILKFVVHEDQIENIQEALAKAKEAGNTEFDGPALDWICIDYLASGNIAQALGEMTAPEAEGEVDSIPTGTPEDRITAFVTGVIDVGRKLKKGNLLYLREGRMQRVQKRIKANQFRRFARIIRMTHSQWNEEMDIVNYDQVWSMAQFFVHAKDGKYRKKFTAYINDVVRGRPSLPAFKKRFGRNLPDLQKEYNEWWLSLEGNPTKDLYDRITVETLVSFLARAKNNKLAFDSAEEFFNAARQGQCDPDIKVGPS